MASKDPSQQIDNYLIEALHQATDDNQRISLIQALGNTKNPDLIDKIKGFYKDQNRDVRTAAIFASRFSPDSFLILLEFLTSANFSDSLAAARALRYLNLTIDQNIILFKQWPNINFVQSKDQLLNSTRSLYNRKTPSQIRDILADLLTEEGNLKLREKLESMILSH